MGHGFSGGSAGADFSVTGFFFVLVHHRSTPMCYLTLFVVLSKGHPKGIVVLYQSNIDSGKHKRKECWF
jgi:hypothetical protein